MLGAAAGNSDSADKEYGYGVGVLSWMFFCGVLAFATSAQTTSLITVELSRACRATKIGELLEKQSVLMASLNSAQLPVAGADQQPQRGEVVMRPAVRESTSKA